MVAAMLLTAESGHWAKEDMEGEPERHRSKLGTSDAQLQEVREGETWKASELNRAGLAAKACWPRPKIPNSGLNTVLLFSMEANVAFSNKALPPSDGAGISNIFVKHLCGSHFYFLYNERKLLEITNFLNQHF